MSKSMAGPRLGNVLVDLGKEDDDGVVCADEEVDVACWSASRQVEEQ